MMASYLWRDLALLSAVALVARGVAAVLVPWAPYLDGSYYTVVAERLATGHGFTVPVIWAYLDVGATIPDHASLPIPSNAHWPPLGPLVAAGGMVLFGPGWNAGQVPMVLISAALPAMTYLVGWQLFRSRYVAIGSALLAIFSGPLFIVYPAVDNFALMGLFGTGVLWLSMLAVRSPAPDRWIVAAAAVAGLAALTRFDGVLLPLAPATAWLVGEMAYEQAGADCVTVNVCPATVNAPLRAAPVFALTLKETVPLAELLPYARRARPLWINFVRSVLLELSYGLKAGLRRLALLERLRHRWRPARPWRGAAGPSSRPAPSRSRGTAPSWWPAAAGPGTP